MDKLDGFMTMVSEKNISDAHIRTLLDVLDIFAKEHLENP